jgi:methionyl-tRNA formyltransferase
MKKLNIFISGQKYFGEEILHLCLQLGHNVVGVCCPLGDKYIGKLASINDIKIISAGMLNSDTFPKNIDLGITAHSFDYIGKKTRYMPKIGWIGYHPSLLPRHRGKSSIEWAVKMKDPITGGTVFWLNAGIDRGDIAYQDWIWIPPKLLSMSVKDAARHLWRSELMDMGVNLIKKALNDIANNVIIKNPQRNDVSTWEPSTEVKDIFRPDSLMLLEKNPK